MSEQAATPQTGAQTDVEEEQPCWRVKVFLDETLQSNFERGSLTVPLPDSAFMGWNNRISLDVRAEAWLSPDISFTLADRLNHITGEDMDSSEEGLENDLKELYLTWNVQRSYFLDFGRLNVKNGVATGFNPTDYFKRNAVPVRISEDPRVLRENRLGVVMARGQALWENGALSVVAAPEVSDDEDRWWSEDAWDLGLDRTNDHSRFLVKANVNAFRDLNPEVLYFYDEGRSNCGLNLTKGLGNRVVVYSEWSIGQGRDIISNALRDAQDAGIIPSNFPTVLPVKDDLYFRNQLAVGFSYTEDVKRTTWLEYQYNESGFSRKDWEDWFDAGALAKDFLQNPALEALGRGMLGELWWIRKWAQDAQEPLNRHSLYIRSQWREAFLPKLDLSGIALINLYDGSCFLQPLAEYHISNSLTLGLTLNFFLGSDRSQFGSMQRIGDVKVGATYYF
jgi:hypothetical protein